MRQDRRLNDTLDEERVVPGGPGFAAHLARYRRARGTLCVPSFILDVGCGTGYGADLLAVGGNRVVGLDASATAIRFAIANFGDAAGFVVGDACSLPFPDHTFDVVTCFEVIEHTGGPELLAGEVSRILKPGGRLYLSTPHARMERLHNRACNTPHYPYHVSPLTPRVLLRILHSRFRHVRLYGQTPDLGLPHLMLKSLDPLGLRLLLPPRGQRMVRSALATGTDKSANASCGGTGFRFSRWVSRSSAILYAEAVK